MAMRAQRYVEEVNTEDPVEITWRGIELCRRGEWQEGLYWLSLALESDVQTAELPGLLFSYLGYGIARYQGQKQQGLKLCSLGVRVELHQPESYYLLARTQLLLNDRRSAVDVIEQGLQVDAGHEGLRRLKGDLGLRRPPVFGALPRGHFLNRWFGKLRHRLLRLLN